jgi:hypothetical protein
MEPIMKKNKQNKDSGLLVSFKDTAIAFQHKSDRELFLSYLIFGLTKSPFLVKFLSQAAKITLAIGLPVKPFIKATVFKQFCGGEKKEEYSKIIAKLAKRMSAQYWIIRLKGPKMKPALKIPPSSYYTLLSNLNQIRIFLVPA